MDEDALVLLVPRVQRREVEADRVDDAGDRRLHVAAPHAGALHVADAQAHPRDAPAAEVADALLVHQRVRIHVADRDEELRIGRPLPEVERGGGVEHDAPAELGADATGHRLDVVDRHEGLGIAAHLVPLA
jgi:hypothetical protein